MSKARLVIPAVVLGGRLPIEVAHTYGEATHHGLAGALTLNKPTLGMARHP